ncbi:Membrane-anchored protein predicted to be involved in regulation of amylopullulanase [Legionella busanensis]|uniref:Membrane-anchored protein predicted to be involved in regulation of amylopullulanase n=1 Tax=Legionella busanensis TaxID=190655 RepID=A0A378JGX9_9GAMM|nr:DUF3536 domain-containing protein [Legionella busanensis]STX50374.1 Membrane-anchored protein predicted to be involved in regulation of amylopullulanase [Legionella busanensis]
MTNKYLCIHGHFYQPPRENPWLEAVENQESAAPYHDWNERITEECYAPNAASRTLNSEGKITTISNNYEKISFNFGPTLLSWINEKNPLLLQLLREADTKSQERLNGHGNALAQSYNHIIMPLANSRDKYTQIYWGIKDFEYYFGRSPEGMWLSETAVDLETLDIMSELGIKFTILAPNQLQHIRRLNSDEEWYDDFTIGTPYLQHLPSGRTITLFFYDGGVSKAVAFEKLLTHGENFAHRLLDAFPPEWTANTLMHIATDGETYGHHHPHGDMGLAYALHYIEQQGEVEIVNYGYFLEAQPPEFEVEIWEHSSWSCAHGVERWKSNCGCNNGQGWHQEWRGPLRQALDWLRDALIPAFEERVGNLVNDPWAARNDYIEVILHRDKQNEFLAKHAKRKLKQHEKESVLKWMELQRHAMLMYTSCGWFFDELSGIETVQIMKYAARVIQLHTELTGESFEETFIEKLALAPSNFTHFKNGAQLYNMFVKPLSIDLFKVSAHLAASLPFMAYEDKVVMYCYECELINTQKTIEGKTQLISGELIVTSKLTSESLRVWYWLFYQGDHNLICAIKHPDASLEHIGKTLHEVFITGDIFQVVKLFENYFGEETISLRDLFYDTKLKITEDILSTSLADLELNYRRFFDDNAPMINFISDISIELPRTIKSALNSLINSDIVHFFLGPNPNIEDLESIFDKAQRLRVRLDKETIGFHANHMLHDNAMMIEHHINDKDFLHYLIKLVAFVKTMPVNVNLWHMQNEVYKLLQENEQNQKNPLLTELASQLDLEIEYAYSTSHV